MEKTILIEKEADAKTVTEEQMQELLDKSKDDFLDLLNSRGFNSN